MRVNKEVPNGITGITSQELTTEFSQHTHHTCVDKAVVASSTSKMLTTSCVLTVQINKMQWLVSLIFSF